MMWRRISNHLKSAVVMESFDSIIDWKDDFFSTTSSLCLGDDPPVLLETKIEPEPDPAPVIVPRPRVVDTLENKELSDVVDQLTPWLFENLKFPIPQAPRTFNEPESRFFADSAVTVSKNNKIK